MTKSKNKKVQKFSKLLSIKRKTERNFKNKNKKFFLRNSIMTAKKVSAKILIAENYNNALIIS